MTTTDQLAKWREEFEKLYQKMDLALTERQHFGEPPKVEYYEISLEPVWQGYLRAKQENKRIGTHADGCHTWGSAHYECALRRIAELEAQLKHRGDTT